MYCSLCCLALLELFHCEREIVEKVTLPEEIQFVGQLEFKIDATKRAASKTLKNASCQMFLENKLYRMCGNVVKQRDAKGNLADFFEGMKVGTILALSIVEEHLTWTPAENKTI